MHAFIKEKGGTTEFVEILCPSLVNKKLIKKIQEVLVKQEYLFNGFYKEGKLDKATKSAIEDFQKAKGIYFGALTLEVLINLGVEF
jgi:hypothetical protein